MNEAPREKGTSIWTWIAVGCGGCLALVVIVFAMGAWWVKRTVNDFKSEMNDPVKREAKVKRLLRTEALPEGYYAGFGLKVPFFMEMAILTDRPDAIEGDGPPEPGKRGFFYFDMRQMGEPRKDLDDFFAGKKARPSTIRDHSSGIQIGERLAEGEIVLESGSKIRWVALTGEVGEDQPGESIVTILEVDCGKNDRIRVGMWFGPAAGQAQSAGEDEPGPTPEASQFADTPADPEAIKAFMSHFALCRP